MPTLPQVSTTNPNRLVAVLTPLLFAPLAGGIAAGVAKYGIDVDDGQLQAIFIAGATIALAKSAQWTKGWQSFEQRKDAAAAAPMALAEDDLDDELGDELDDEEPEPIAFAELVAGEAGDEGLDDLDGDDIDDDFDDDDFEAEAAELLAGQGS